MKPLYGQGFFHLCLPNIIWYTIVFDYKDEEREYYRLMKRGGRRLEEEIAELKKSMQKFLDEELMLINGNPVKPYVKDVWIEIRGEPTRPSIVFSILIPFTSPDGNRIAYEDYYEEEVADYDYVVYWFFPQCVRIIEYNMPGNIELSSGHLRVFVRKGTRIPGYESILFDISTCGGR